VISRLTGETVEPGETATAEQRLGKHVPVATNIYRMQEATWLWSQVPDGRLTPRRTGRLTVGRKLTSTSSKINPMLGGITELHCSWGEIATGTWPSRLGESQK
jgi:hypothetical protein